MTTTCLTVFHGTGDYNLKEIQEEGPIFRSRNYHRRRKSFCTTSDFKVAARFALRRTSADDFLCGKITGIVLEFEVSGVETKDYESVRDPSSLQDEHEIAVYNPKGLKLVAVWRNSDTWNRYLI
jgi:hypothetical protein